MIVPCRRQRGVAVVTALLLTTLAVTIVASLFWQQQVQVRSMENQRLHLQTRWVLRGALDWARLILQQEGRDNRAFTREDGVWATPLAETRLDDYLERERQNNETYDATLSGQIYDAQARYNLANLANPAGAAGVDEDQLKVFGRLLRNLQLDEALARPVAQTVARARSAQGLMGKQDASNSAGSSAPLDLIRVEDLLAVPGVTPQTVERLREFVIVLPVGVNVNANTARAEVLAALFDNMSVSEAQSLVAKRKRVTWTTQAEVERDADARKLTVAVVVRSDNFLVQSQVRLERAALETWALIRRQDPKQGTLTLPVWIREL